jgi:hypothetical protein
MHPFYLLHKSPLPFAIFKHPNEELEAAKKRTTKYMEKFGSSAFLEGAIMPDGSKHQSLDIGDK